jgi:hypothetical protein
MNLTLTRSPRHAIRSHSDDGGAISSRFGSNALSYEVSIRQEPQLCGLDGFYFSL